MITIGYNLENKGVGSTQSFAAGQPSQGQNAPGTRSSLVMLLTHAASAQLLTDGRPLAAVQSSRKPVLSRGPPAPLLCLFWQPGSASHPLPYPVSGVPNNRCSQSPTCPLFPFDF